MPKLHRPEAADELRRVRLFRQVMHEQLPAGALREVLHRGRLAGARLAHEQDRLLHAHAGRDAFHQREVCRAQSCGRRSRRRRYDPPRRAA